MKESSIEKHLVKVCKEVGALCYKFVSPGNTGVPDRLLIFPHGLVAFLELKAPGKKPSPKQESVMVRMQANCANATWVDSKESVEVTVMLWARLDKVRKGY